MHFFVKIFAHIRKNVYLCITFKNKACFIIAQIKIMNRTVGTYHFGRSYNKWGIWQVEYVSEDGTSSSSRKIENCDTAEQAYRRIYELNGWGIPKYIPTWMKQQ